MQRKRLRIVVLIGWFANSGFAASPEYFCPRINMRLVAETGSVTGGAITFGLKGMSDDAASVTQKTAVVLKLHECSTRTMQCWRVEQVTATGDSLHFFMVVPRTLRGIAERQFEGVRILTWFANWDDRRRPAQVINWQRIGDQDVAIEFTITPGIGLTHWDGLRLGSGEVADTCVLETGKGLFSNVKFRF